MQKLLSSLYFLIFVLLPVHADEYDVENEIAATNREIKRVVQERESVRKSAARDREEFADYQRRTQDRLKTIASETDSVRRETSVFQRRSDSLGAVLVRVEAGQREYDIKQKRLREVLVSLCDSAVVSSQGTTPSLSAKSVSALSFLKSELASAAIDNTEGMHRLYQILNDLESQLINIQIDQRVSPVSEISGTVSGIRIGGVFEAVVNSRGDRCAIWSAAEDKWLYIKDPDVASRVMKAVKVREGKTLPDFIELPFSEEKEAADE